MLVGWNTFFIVVISISTAILLRSLSISVLRFPKSMSPPAIPLNQSQWKAALESLPETPDNIPAFFFAHGSPMLLTPNSAEGRFGSRASAMTWHGPDGPLANFLKDFGPTLLNKYKPKGILVFSAHWETSGERLGT
jgi:aromatic ring-opening dioxygenase catalytic subunit (LigB family)